MKKTLFLCAVAALGVAAQAQTARKLTVNLTPDGASNIQVFLPETPSGRAIVGCPGGGYSHLSMQNEGTDWAEYFNSQGIAYLIQPAGRNSVNLFFGKSECIEVIKHLVNCPLYELSPEKDFILGAMLGYNICDQCKRYCNQMEKATVKQKTDNTIAS